MMGRFPARRVGGLLIAGLLAAAGPIPAQEERPPSVNFSFDQVDIRLLVKLVGEMTGKRFVVDKAVTGKVTVITPTQIPLEEVYPLFLSILESSGYSVLRSGDLYQVVALPEAIIVQAPIAAAGRPAEAEGLITKVIRLTHISALELRKVLEPMVRGGKAGALAAFASTNHLIITDTAENIRRLEQVIAELDQPGAARVVEVIPLRYAAAEDIARDLNQALREGESAGSALSRQMRQVTEGGGSLPAGVVVVPTPHANSLVVVGTVVELSEMKRVITLLDTEPARGSGRLNAIFLRYLSAEEAAKSLNGLLAKMVEKDQRQRIAIEPSMANNALLISASPKDFELVRDLVDQLDQVPQQVLVEVLVAEVATGKSLDLGVELSTIDLPKDNRTTPLGRTRLDNVNFIDNVLSNVVPQGFTFALSRGTFVDQQGRILPRVPILIRALAENRDIRVLANVPLWAQNNTEASVSVVDNIPILRSTIEGGSGTARDVIQNIDRVDVGVKLKLTPHINPQREVQLQLNPAIEAIVDAGSSGTAFTPTIAKREVSNTVTVPDKATVVISGLIREDTIKEVRKVPLLGDIPVLGVLFRSKSDRKQRTNLLICVTPHIVTSMDEANAMKKELEERSGLVLPPERLSVRPKKGE
jgi:general secretion pathway protein D